MQTAFRTGCLHFFFLGKINLGKIFPKKSKKPLDKQKNYVIILKCVIILFSFGGILRFFQEIIVKMSNSFLKNTAILPKTLKTRKGEMNL